MNALTHKFLKGAFLACALCIFSGSASITPILPMTGDFMERSFLKRSDFQKLSAQSVPSFQFEANNKNIPKENQIQIPSLNLTAPLVTVSAHNDWRVQEQNIQAGLLRGVTVFPGVNTPEQNGNFFLMGHSSFYGPNSGKYKDIFATLPEVQNGEMVTVYWQGQKYQYKIKDRMVVDPTFTDVLKQPMNHKLLTLMTCYPIGSTKERFLLIGEMVQ